MAAVNWTFECQKFPLHGILNASLLTVGQHIFWLHSDQILFQLRECFTILELFSSGGHNCITFPLIFLGLAV